MDMTIWSPFGVQERAELVEHCHCSWTPIENRPYNINMYQGLYARVLVDVDISKRLPERILASLNNKRRNINKSSFFVKITYENLSKFVKFV